MLLSTAEETLVSASKLVDTPWSQAYKRRSLSGALFFDKYIRGRDAQAAASEVAVRLRILVRKRLVDSEHKRSD
jgi:hypothetical protein